MKAHTFTVRRLVELMRETLQLELLGGETGLAREITSSEVSSPGLVLAGYVERFPARRVQVFGETEISYLHALDAARRREVLELFFSFAVPCVIVTKAQTLPDELLETAAHAGVPVLRSALKTAELYRRVKPALAEEFAPATTLHGSLADVYGVGLLFVGQSGIGKSECVLDLVERGHRLVADDLVIATRRGNDIIIGRGHELQGHHMEIRGVGVIDVQAVFGIRAVRQQKRIEVVVQLEEWDKAAVIDRTGLDGVTTTILDVEVPKVTIPLNPGKNITVVAEVVAMNHLLRYSGVDPAETFNQRLINRMRSAAGLRQYLAEDNE
ncbi:MAG: HPr(Ser) kinase/phosphatase [Gemmatimonadaceae bacterium]